MNKSKALNSFTGLIDQTNPIKPAPADAPTAADYPCSWRESALAA
ncbi:MAG TPA: hypothetical protein VFY65_01740 [Longimicrobium sp.]|nr:hypothetical protein [Longimicrobium sp.]